MSFNEECFVWLNCQSVLTPAKINGLINKFGSCEKVLLAFENSDGKLKEFVSDIEIRQIMPSASKKFVKSYIENLNKLGIKVYTKYSENLSERLIQIFEECRLDILYLKGDESLLETKSAAIVGCRMPDSYGKRVTEDFSSILTTAGLTIVSGLAAGVDSIAHKKCLEKGGKTIAVLGGGFNRIYPSFNADLANKIIENGGLLVSEYAPQTDAVAFHFPVRNRIIASISDAVIITQMGEKSGAMHTKNYAIDFGKDLFIVPADCYREASFGNLRVLDELPDSIATTPAAVLTRLKIDLKKDENVAVQLSAEEQMVINSLKNGEKHYNEILAFTKFSPQALNSLLTNMRINGIIRQSAGNFYSL